MKLLRFLLREYLLKIINHRNNYMSEFSTKTEEFFSSIMNKNNILCSKVPENKIDKVPDFLCKFDKYKVVFELKDLNESGTTVNLMSNMIVRKNTIESTICRFIEGASRKFLNKEYISCDSALVITNLRLQVPFQNIMTQVQSTIINKLSEYPQIGNLIITGYNNKILAFHIFENKNSKRIIKKDFFNNLNHKYY